MVLTAMLCIGSLFDELKPLAAAEQKDGKVKELLKERLATLKTLADLTVNDYKAGRVSFDRVHQAMRAVLDAELELCESAKERVTILEQAVKLAKEFETVAEAQFRIGKVTQSDVLLAKVNRLDTEIALERAKAASPK
jgi:outer membrane protein TolC